MAISSRCVRISLAIAFACGLTGLASAQRVITLNPTQITGKIVQVRPGAIQVNSSSGQLWTIKCTPKTHIKVTGTASPDVLTSGVCVHFVAKIEKRTSRGQERIDELTIFTPTQGDDDRTLGVMRAADKPAEADRHGGGPGGGPGGPLGAPDPGIGEVNTNKPGRQRGNKAGGDKSVPDVDSYDIAAQVVSYHSGRLIVSAPNNYFKPRVSVELSPQATISLDLGDLSRVAPGDSITVRGYYATAGLAEATSVQVELSKPLGSGRKSHYVARPQSGKEQVAKAATKPDARTETKPAPKHVKKGDLDIPDIPDDANKPAEAAKPIDADRETELAKFLDLGAAEAQGRSAFSMTLGQGAPDVYKPCKLVQSKDLRLKFGPTTKPPEGVQGNMPDANGQQKQMNWELWTYGKIKILIDEHSQTAYVAGAPEIAPAEAPAAPPQGDAKPDAQPKPAQDKPPQNKPAAKSEDKDVFEK